METPEKELEARIKSELPLHWLAWHNEHVALADLLQQDQCNVDIEKTDGRGRTALMLSITLGHLDSARVLLAHGADANCENADGWTVAQEAVATGDPELVQLVVRRREAQRQKTRASGIPRLLQQLRDAPDFYVEMRWEFASWVPLVSRLCPSDTYKVYKRGANVRVDTTLLGFEQTVGGWQRGSRSYVFRGGTNDCSATLLEVDHDARQVIVEEMLADSSDIDVDIVDMSGEMERRLTAPIVATYVDTDKIAFERLKSGLMGALWKGGNGGDRIESVAGHECRVFAATNVQLVTKTRTEHLRTTESSPNTNANVAGPLHSFLSGGTVQQNTQQDTDVSTKPLTALEYFSTKLGDIGTKAKRVEMRVQRFKATLWLAEHYPLSLPEQVLPIVDLMATSSPHFAKLRDFIRLQLPAGFPVKIEIPLFHVLNARITFGNIFGKESSIPGVSQLIEQNNDQRLACVVDDIAFEPPPTYTIVGGGLGVRPSTVHEEHDELLQFAIRQSLLDAGTDKEEVDIWEALRYDSKPAVDGAGRQQQRLIGEEERQLQQAIEASLCVGPVPNVDAKERETDDGDMHDLMEALRLSQEERVKEDARRQQEQRQLDEILKLSLTEK